jgi:hypothetical protein
MIAGFSNPLCPVGIGIIGGHGPVGIGCRPGVGIALTRIIACTVTRTIALVVAVPVSVMIPMPVSDRAPPAPVGCPPSKGHPAIAHPEGKTPSGIGIPVYTVSEGHRPGIIISPVPGPVIKTGPIVHTAHVAIGMHIARRVTHIDHIGCGIIDIYIFHIVNRGFRRDFLNLIRNHRTYHPGACGSIGFKPDGIIAAIIALVNQQHRFISVNRILHIGAFNFFKLGLTVVGDLQFGLLAVHLGRLRYLVLQ